MAKTIPKIEFNRVRLRKWLNFFFMSRVSQMTAFQLLNMKTEILLTNRESMTKTQYHVTEETITVVGHQNKYIVRNLSLKPSIMLTYAA